MSMFAEVKEHVEIAAKLMKAATEYDVRTDRFAQGKGNTCRDIAKKLLKYKEFASPAQRDFAMKLIEWASTPKPAPTPAQEVKLPNITVILSKFAHFYFKDYKISKSNGKSLWWITFNRVLIGKIEGDTVLHVWPSKARLAQVESAKVVADLVALEADPMAAMKADGKLTGRCCCCGRELTDPQSIAAGIGPICEAKAGGF